MIWWLGFPLCGLIMGGVQGLLGLGGAVIIVPMFVLIFTHLGFSDAIIMHSAQACSLLLIFINASTAVGYHYHRQYALLHALRYVWLIILPISYLGAWCASLLHTDALIYLFIVFMLFSSIVMSINLKTIHATHSMNMHWVTTLTFPCVAFISSLLGIGSGSLLSPVLSCCRFQMKQIVALSSVSACLIGLAGSLGFIVHGWFDPAVHGHQYMLGYVYFPAVFGTLLGSLPMVHLASRWAYAMPQVLLRRILAAVIFSGAILMYLERQ